MSDELPQVIIIAGPNGAGKTTLAPFLLRDTLGILEYVNADPIALGLSGFDPASVAFEAGRVMLRRLHELAAQRKTFALESTLAAKSYAGFKSSGAMVISSNCFFFGCAAPTWQFIACE